MRCGSDGDSGAQVPPKTSMLWSGRTCSHSLEYIVEFFYVENDDIELPNIVHFECEVFSNLGSSFAKTPLTTEYIFFGISEEKIQHLVI